MQKVAQKSGGILVAFIALIVLVLGCNKSSSPSGPSGNTPGSVITVTGKVLDLANQPVPSVPVLITGKTSTNTDANGAFTITNVTVPYDVTVINAAAQNALVYKGLSRNDPTLVFPVSSSSTPRSAVVNGSVRGGAFTPTQPSDYRTVVLFASPEASWRSTTGSSGSFSVGGTWYGPTTTTGSLYALQYQADASGIPVANGFKGYAVKSGLVLNDASTTNNQNDTLTSISTGQLTGTIAAPTGYTLGSRSFYIRYSSTALVQLFGETNTNSSVSYYTPTISGATVVLSASAAKPSTGTSVTFKVGLATSQTGVAISIPAGPELSLPIAGATGVDTTVAFSWTALSGGVHLVIFSSTGHPSFYVVTTGTSTTIPNLKAYGLGLPASTSYSWQIYAFSPVATIDEAAASTGFLTALTGPTALTADASIAVTTSRSFTTAP
jgi:hypothetical protein